MKAQKYPSGYVVTDSLLLFKLWQYSTEAAPQASSATIVFPLDM